MSIIDRPFIGEEQQQQHQSAYSSNVLSLSIENMSEINLDAIENQSSKDVLHELLSTFDYTTFTYQSCLALLFLFLCLLTIAGNFLVLIIFRRIRTVGNLFILSLATADLIVGCFVMPIAGIYAIIEKWNMGLALCQIWLSVDFTASTASIFNLLTLSLDRYWSITSPLQYLGKRTRARALLLIGLAWGLSLLWVIPIFGWDRFVSNDTHLMHTIVIKDEKCEPAYTHSKVFKVSTAIINFYLPLLVLISLNARIYYEIKRRYKSVLLQRHSNQINELSSTHKINASAKYSRAPITVTLCDSDKQLCSTPINTNENETLIKSKRSPVKCEQNSNLKINFREDKLRPRLSSSIPENRRSSLKRAYSFIEKSSYTKTHCTWFIPNREPSRPSLKPALSSSFPLNPQRSLSKNRLNVDERCAKQLRDYHSARIHSHEQISTFQRRHNSYDYQNPQCHSLPRNTKCRESCLCQQYSSSDELPTRQTTTNRNIFKLCHCCSATASAATIHSNAEHYNNATKASTSSISSLSNRKQRATPRYSLPRNSLVSNPLTHSNARASSKIRQSTIWNQQEKAFRQLFAIVFGFTCCFLPYFILYMVVAFCGSCVSERFLTASVWLGYVNSTINPFLYALSNKHFRRTFNRILKRESRRQSFYN